MRTAEQKAARLGIARLYLFTADRRLAHGFYLRMGWKILETVEYRSYRVIIMAKDLRQEKKSG